MALQVTDCNPVITEVQGRSRLGRNLEKSATKTGKIRQKWEEKGKIGKKKGSLSGACPCGPEGLATALHKLSL